MADRDEHVLERRPARMVCVDVAGDDRLHARVLGEVPQERVPARIAAFERPLQLDVEALRPERAGKRDGGVRVARAESLPGAAGEADESLVQLREQGGIERGRQELALLRASVSVGGREEAAEVRVALRRLDQERHV